MFGETLFNFRFISLMSFRDPPSEHTKIIRNTVVIKTKEASRHSK